MIVGCFWGSRDLRITPYLSIGPFLGSSSLGSQGVAITLDEDFLQPKLKTETSLASSEPDDARCVVHKILETCQSRPRFWHWHASGELQEDEHSSRQRPSSLEAAKLPCWPYYMMFSELTWIAYKMTGMHFQFLQFFVPGYTQPF